MDQNKPDVLFNNFIKSNVLFTLNDLKILENLEKAPLSLEEIGQKLNLNSKLLKTLLKIAENYNLLEIKDDLFSLSQEGREVYKTVGFFTWAIGGYGSFLRSLSRICRDEIDSSEKSLIQGDFVAKGSNECYKHLMQKIFIKEISSIPFSKVADLGCGNAGKLIDFAQKDPTFYGLGVDINPEAIQLAKKKIKLCGLENQVKVICKNLFDVLNSNIQFPEIETVTSFMMMHDLFNISGLSDKLFNQLQRSFPNVQYFAVADTVLSSRQKIKKNPIFTRCFELIHDFMRIRLFDLDYYLEVFKKSNLKLIRQVNFGVPNTYLFILSVK